MKKPVRILFTLLIVLVLLLSAFLSIRSGILLKPTRTTLAKAQEVPQYDILEWQYQRELEIKEDYQAGSYSLDNPYWIVDPYNMNPCSGLIIFESDEPGTVLVTIHGDYEYTSFQYKKESTTGHFEVPILGLYPGRENRVSLSDDQGRQMELKIKTDPLPLDFQTYELESAIPEEMEPGITLFISIYDNSYTALLDQAGMVRGYLSNRYMAHGTSIILLRNGHLLATGDEYKQIPYNMSSLWEFNWLGKIYREIEVPNAVHHDISELPNGDILAVSNNADMFTTGTREDMVIRIDRNTGEVIKQYDFRRILDETRSPVSHFHPNIQNLPNIDWMHANAADFLAEDNLLIVSSPIQSQVVAIDADTTKIRWILGPHEGYEGSSIYLKPYLLTPKGGDFEWSWAQHAPRVLPDMDGNPDTLDLLVFDNGQNRSFYADRAVPAAQNYSRAVQYRIDPKAMTVEQIWEYGKECGVSCYATFLGDAEYLPITGNILIDFGGQIFSDGQHVDDIISSVLGDTVTRSTIREVTASGKVIYSVRVMENAYTKSAGTYQALRIPLYMAGGYQDDLGQVHGQRSGTSYLCSTTNLVPAPPIYFGNLSANLDRIHMEGTRLVVDGRLFYRDQSYLLGRAIFVFRSTDNTYIYAANSGLNSRFFLSVDTSPFEPGTYQLSIIGGVMEGNDALNGKLSQGYFQIPYKLTVP